MELCVLKIDNDSLTKKGIIKTLKERLSYMSDIGIFNIDEIEKIELIFKTKYSSKIYLKSNLKDEKSVIVCQLLLGSDYKKEVNTILNHFKLEMEYSNRMFNIKRYAKGKILIAKVHNVTQEILKHVQDKKRLINKN